MLKRFFTSVANHKIISGVVILALVIGGYFSYKKMTSKATAVQYVTGTVQKGTLTVSISGTGQVAALNQVDIKPQTAGEVTSVRVAAGQQVKSGQVLATLDQRAAATSVTSAKAAVAQAQASYDKLIAGLNDTDLTLAKLTLQSAQSNLDNAKKNYDQTVITQQQAVDKANSALLNTNTQAIANNTNSSVIVTISGSYTGKAQGVYNIKVLSGSYYNLTGLANTSQSITRGLAQPLDNGLYITFSQSGSFDDSTIWTISLPNTTSSSYLNNKFAYDSALQNQTQTISQAQTSIDSATNALAQAQANYDAKVATAAPADVESANAQLDSAKSQLASAETGFSNTIITAPFDGVIAKLNVQKGDQGSSATAVATLVTNQQMAQVSLNEVDVAKIKLAQKATMTFDAVSGLTITGTVGEIDTIGTVTQGVVNYNVKILFDTQADQVKPGMSVSANIITDVKQDVLMVPSSAVKTSGGSSYVESLVSGQPVQHTVQTGLSNDSDTEVSGDIKEGDEIITQTIKPTTTTQTGQTGTSLLQGLGGGNRGFGGGGVGGGARTTTGGRTTGGN